MYRTEKKWEGNGSMQVSDSGKPAFLGQQPNQLHQYLHAPGPKQRAGNGQSAAARGGILIPSVLWTSYFAIQIKAEKGSGWALRPKDGEACLTGRVP